MLLETQNGRPALEKGGAALEKGGAALEKGGDSLEKCGAALEKCGAALGDNAPPPRKMMWQFFKSSFGSYCH